MAVQLTAPGVYVEEIPSGVRTITGVATSVTAFIGRALRGAVDAPITVGSWADFERACGGLWVDSELSQAVRAFFLNGGSAAVIVRVVHSDAATATVNLDPLVTALQLEARSPGAWGETLRVEVSLDAPFPGAEYALTADQFHLTISEVDPVVEAVDGFEDAVLKSETHRFLSSDPNSPRFVESVLQERSRLVRVPTGGQTGRPDATASPASFTGGEDGTAPVFGEVEAAVALLDLADVVNLLCIPPYDGASVAASVWETALAWCEAERAMLIVDPDDAWVDHTAAAAVTGLTSLRSPNAVLLYPRVLMGDPLKDGLLREFAPSGVVAGVIARTDASRGVWKAPAGLEATMLGVSSMSMGGQPMPLAADRQGLLNSRGVNPLVAMGAAGPVVWGSRTARGADTMASEWKYVPVRRVALYIEESLARGLQWVVFEPNDEPLWAQIRLAVGTFMDNLFRQGAFQGSKPKDAYRVACDATTTTQTDVDNGIVRIQVAFAPLKPAEFVVLYFQQMAGQGS